MIWPTPCGMSHWHGWRHSPLWWWGGWDCGFWRERTATKTHHRAMRLGRGCDGKWVGDSLQLISAKDAVSQICLLMKQDYNALGFMPQMAVEARWRHNQIILQQEGREIYGYLMHGALRAGYPAVVIQAFVDMDARRMGTATAMWHDFVSRTSRAGATHIRLKVAEDLPSNLFWLAMGCRLVNSIHPKHRGWKHVSGVAITAKRAINIYEFNLRDTFLSPSDMGKLWVPRSNEP